jgi:dihydroorotate dehydrogenase
MSCSSGIFFEINTCMDLYQSLLRPLIFSGLKADPETVHQQLIAVCGWLAQGESASSSSPRTDLQSALKAWVLGQVQQNFCWENHQLARQLWGLTFPNPIGLAAGFDKDAVAASIWPRFGFGFVEVGTVTYHPQPGNPRPRLFRLPQDRAALNRMGFNNQGAAQMAERLRQAQALQPRQIPLGINLGKSKITPLEEAATDYLLSFRLLKELGDYFVVNVSSPNTPGLRSLQSQAQLLPILEALQQENQSCKPLLIKIAPDLTWQEIDDILDLAKTYNLAGIIATNTTISRGGLVTQTIAATGNRIQEEAGGLSGAPLRDLATEVIRYIHQQTQGQLPIIGVGGIFSPQDAVEKMAAGASLLQVYTGWVYEGPWMVCRLLAGLQKHHSDSALPR